MLPKNLCLLLLFCGSSLLLTAESAVAQDRVPRILLGEETDEFPAVGIVGSVRSGGFCTGTLITPTHVLTAGHCAEVIEGPTSGTFQLGDQIYGTANVVIHPDYNFFTLANDIAILQLDEPVLDVEPSLIFRDAPLVGDLLLIVGYGATGTADGGSDGTFGTKRVGVTTIDEVTRDLVSWTFDDESESNTAAGDSGGPGYINIEGDLFVASITSGGTEPDSILGDFAFNTRVDAFADWIDLVIASTDEPPSTSDPTDPDDGSTDGDEGFWSQPFPFLQFLIDILTQLLEFLTEGVGSEGVESGETTAEQPSETPSDTLSETPAETPADCPVQDPADPVEVETEEPTENPTEDPINEPATDPITEPATDPITQPPTVGAPGGTPPGGTQPGSTPVRAEPVDTTSASVLASWARAIRLRARSLVQADYERLILSGTDEEE
jgi:hypothetical protein